MCKVVQSRRISFFRNFKLLNISQVLEMRILTLDSFQKQHISSCILTIKQHFCSVLQMLLEVHNIISYRIWQQVCFKHIFEQIEMFILTIIFRTEQDTSTLLKQTIELQNLWMKLKHQHLHKYHILDDFVQREIWIFDYSEDLKNHNIQHTQVEHCMLAKCEQLEMFSFVISNLHTEKATMWFDCLMFWTKFSIRMREVEASRNEAIFHDKKKHSSICAFFYDNQYKLLNFLKYFAT